METCQPPIILCNGGPFLESLDVRDEARACFMGAAYAVTSQFGSLKLSTMLRFWASDIPAEYSP